MARYAAVKQLSLFTEGLQKREHRGGRKERGNAPRYVPAPA